jgi:hypothetical protein
MFFYPERVALAGLFVYLCIWFIAPLDLVFPFSWSALGYIGWCYTGFFLGCIRLQPKRQRTVEVSRAQAAGQFSSRTFWVLVLLGGVGMAVRLFDKYVVRGAGLASSVLESREVLNDIAAGPLTALGGALYPFCYIPLIMWWSRPTEYRSHPSAKLIASVLFMLPALDALLLLSRSQMLVAFSMMYFAASCVLYAGRPLPRQFILPVILGFVGLSLVSIVAFAMRLNEMDMDLTFSIMNSTYGYVITPSEFAARILSEGNSAIAGALAAILPLLQYYLHGLAEFGLLWDRPDQQFFLYGAEHFTPYLKTLMLFGYTPNIPPVEPYYRTGVFTTFFGPLWVDFGWFGPPFMLLFGMACKYFARRAKAGELGAMPVHSYFCVVIFFMPVINFVVSAQGMYIINAFLIFRLLLRKRA